MFKNNFILLCTLPFCSTFVCVMSFIIHSTHYSCFKNGPGSRTKWKWYLSAIMGARIRLGSKGRQASCLLTSALSDGLCWAEINALFIHQKGNFILIWLEVYVAWKAIYFVFTFQSCLCEKEIFYRVNLGKVVTGNVAITKQRTWGEQPWTLREVTALNAPLICSALTILQLQFLRRG